MRRARAIPGRPWAAWVLVIAACRAPPPHAAMTAASLRASVEVLASDAFAGREVLTPGADAAATWLVAQLEGTGLAPLPGAPSLRVPFPIRRIDWDAAQTELIVGDTTFRGGVDVAPVALSAPGFAYAPVVFAGYGISVPDRGWDDYAGLDVADRFVLALDHGPEEGDRTRWPDGSSADTPAIAKARTAYERGAAGIVVVTDPLNHPASDTAGRPIPPPFILPFGTTEPDVPIVALKGTRAVGEAIAQASGRTLADLQEAVNDGTRPADLVLVGTLVEAYARLDPATIGVEGENLFAVLAGTDLADQWVVVGAHYDHLGQRAPDGAEDRIYNGADDNASGSAVVLALAKALAARPDPPRRTVVFAWFDGEEAGLLGSIAALQRRHLPPDRIVTMVNFDMVGRNPRRPVQVSGDAHGRGVRRRTLAAADAEGLDVRLMGSAVSRNSDHVPFHDAGIPVIVFYSGQHADYHGVDDEADRLDYPRMERVTRVGWRLLVDLADGRWTP